MESFICIQLFLFMSIGNCAGDSLQQRQTIRILLFKIPTQTGRHSSHLQSITDAHAMFSCKAWRQIA